MEASILVRSVCRAALPMVGPDHSTIVANYFVLVRMSLESRFGDT